MRIYAVVHLYPFQSNSRQSNGEWYGFSGAELYLHRTLLALIKATGAEVQVLQIPGYSDNEKIGRPPAWEFEGIKVRLLDHVNNMPTDGDIYMTHLTLVAEQVILWCKFNEKKCIYINHNTSLIPMLMRSVGNLKVIHNSRFVKANYDYGLPEMIWVPPIDTEHFSPANTGNREMAKYITLINPIKAKGGLILKRLAELMPHRQFMVVKGGYGKSDIEFPSNVDIVPQRPDMLPIYAVTRVLLMPSLYESWGMAAAEAQSCGVPVVASHRKETMGMVQNLRSSALYVYDRLADDKKDKSEAEVLLQWIDHINSLDDHYNYAAWSMRSRQNQLDRNTDDRIEQLVDFFSPVA
jgi:glycosyltransferase involved in cell wall biosynthesis